MTKITIACLLLLMLAACSNAAPTRPSSGGFSQPVPNQVLPPAGNGAAKAPDPNPNVQVILVPSEIVIGPNRFAVGLIDPQRGMIKDASVHFRYFDVGDPAKPSVESDADATRLQTPDGESTIYAHEREFQRAGSWGVEVQAKLPDGTLLIKRIAFQVTQRSSALKPGDKVPALETRTFRDVNGDLHQLTSAPKPNPEFYRQTLAQALSDAKPTVVLFSTPAFCQTRLCGPAYDIVSQVAQQYQSQANFISVEVYRGLPNPAETNWELDPAMKAFGLQTEPWVFIISKDVVVYRVEGLFTQGELEQHLKPLAAATATQGR